MENSEVINKSNFKISREKLDFKIIDKPSTDNYIKRCKASERELLENLKSYDQAYYDSANYIIG